MKRKQEFTLIELLITIAIIAILASMLLPALNSARDKAKAISCTNNLKTLGSALNMYTLNYNDFLIPYYNIPGEVPTKIYAYWVGVLCELSVTANGQLKTGENLRRSPNYGVMWGMNTDTAPRPPKGDFSCPAEEFGVQWGGKSFWSHYHFNHPLHGGWYNNDASYKLPFYKISRIDVPSKAISLAERTDSSSGSTMVLLNYMTAGYLDYNRHGSKSGKGRANILYADGHVGSLTRAAATAIKKNPAGNDNYLFRVGYKY